MSSTGEASAQAILDEGEARDWGTDQEDVEAYAAAAGGVAGAAACAAVGAEAAAPLCSELGSWATEWIAGTIYEWCTSSAEAERARQRREDVRRLHNRIAQIEAWEMLNGQMLEERIAALRELHSQLWPDDPWETSQPDVVPAQRQVYPAILLLASHGMPTEPRELSGQVALGLPSLQAEWERLRPEMSDETLFEMLQAEALEISEGIERAYDRSVLELTARAAGDQAEQRARRPQIRVVVRPPQRFGSFGAGGAGVEPTGPGRVRIASSRQGALPALWRMGVAIGGAGVASVIAWAVRRA